MVSSFNLFTPEQLCWTLDESHGNAFSRLGNALQHFFCRKPRYWAILEKYKIPACRLFLCVAAIAVLLLTNKATTCISSLFTGEQSYLWYVWLILLQKCLMTSNILCHQVWRQVFLNAIFKYTWVKCLLETNLASSVKPSVNLTWAVKPWSYAASYWVLK